MFVDAFSWHCCVLSERVSLKRLLWQIWAVDPFFFSLSLRFLRGQLARVCRVGLTLSLIVPPQSILTLLRHLLRYEWAPRPIRRGERTHGGNGRLPPLPEVSDKLKSYLRPSPLSLSLPGLPSPSALSQSGVDGSFPDSMHTHAHTIEWQKSRFSA